MRPPCFPEVVLSTRRSPSLGRVPASRVPPRHQYYESATTSPSRSPVTYGFVLWVHALPLWFRSSGAEALPAGLALFHCRVPTGGLRGGLEDLTGSWAIPPVPLPCSQRLRRNRPEDPSAPGPDGNRPRDGARPRLAGSIFTTP